MDNVSFTTIYIVSMNIMLALVLVRLLANQAKIKSEKIKSGIVIFSWLIIVVVFLRASILPSDVSSLSLFIIILIGVAVSGIILSPLFSTFLNFPQEFLLLPQAFRMFFGAGFIIEAAYGVIPLDYGIIDGVLHVTTAFLATTLAIYIARGNIANKSLIAVNIFGLLDIVVVAYGIAFFILEDIGVNHNVFYAVFFAAPIFIWLHVFSLYKLYSNNKKKEIL